MTSSGGAPGGRILLAAAVVLRLRSGARTTIRYATYLIAAPPPPKHETRPSPAGRFLFGPRRRKPAPWGRLRLSSQPPDTCPGRAVAANVTNPGQICATPRKARDRSHA